MNRGSAEAPVVTITKIYTTRSGSPTPDVATVEIHRSFHDICGTRPRHVRIATVKSEPAFGNAADLMSNARTLPSASPSLDRATEVWLPTPLRHVARSPDGASRPKKAPTGTSAYYFRA